MGRYTLDIDGHPLEMWYSNWNGLERISYDGETVSERRSFSFPVSIHTISLPDPVPEEAGAGELQIRLAGPMGYRVLKNGELAAERDRPNIRYFMSFLVLSIGYLVLEAFMGLIFRVGGVENGLPHLVEDIALLFMLVFAFVLSAWIRREVREDNRGRNAAVPART